MDRQNSSRGLAASIQQALIEFQDPDNTRQEKANEDYYLLRKETVPTVICECGFMSNAAEEALLKSEMISGENSLGDFSGNCALPERKHRKG